MSKRASSGSLPPAKKLHSFFTQKPVGAAGVPGPSRGQFEDSPPSLIHYTHKDPLTSPPPADPVVVILYDLDGTLIKPSSGAKFPKSREDWMWWNDVVPKRLKEDIKTGKHVVILSNQGDGRPKIRREWKAKLPLIAEKLGDNVPFRILAALEKDTFRKPHTGMFDTLVKLYRDKDWEIDVENSVYVGDAAGRRGDHSDTDYTMALNAGLQFVTPEEHFLGQKPAYPSPPQSFRPSDLTDAQNLPLVVPSNTPIAREGKEIVLFVGPPASGKTSFYRRHMKGYEHVNQDTLRTRDACVRAARDHLSEGRAVVIDNTNRDAATRAAYTKLAAELGVPIRLFHFTCPLNLAKHNNTYRYMYGPASEGKRDLLPGSAFNSYSAQFQPPTKKEGFDEIRTVNFVWEGSDEQRKVWDRYLS